MTKLTDAQLEELDMAFAAYNQNVISYEKHEEIKSKIINS